MINFLTAVESPAEVTLGAGRLTCDDVVAVADRPHLAYLDEVARVRILTSHEAAIELSATHEIYGRTTGVGANKDQSVAAHGVAGPGQSIGIDDADRHAQRLLASHATALGEPRTSRQARAIATIRINQLGVGNAGVSPAAVDGLVRMLWDDALPVITDGGGVGTGDLAALAAMAEYVAGRRPSADGRINPDPVALTAHDALPLISSSAATLADAALSVVDLRGLLAQTERLAALTSVAVGSGDGPFHEAVEHAAPTRAIASSVRVLREQRAQIQAARSDATVTPLRGQLQEPYSVRCAAQVIGPARAAVERLAEVVEGYINAGLENPLISAANGIGLNGGTATLAHHGNFYTLELALALDAAALAVAGVASQSADRTGLLLDPEHTALPAFLSDGTPAASGAMLLEYIAAANVGRARSFATPASLQSAHLSHGAEESAPHSSLAAEQLGATVEPLRRVLACELVAAVRSLRMLGEDEVVNALGVPGGGLPAPADLPRGIADRDLAGDLRVAEEIVRLGW